MFSPSARQAAIPRPRKTVLSATELAARGQESGRRDTSGRRRDGGIGRRSMTRDAAVVGRYLVIAAAVLWSTSGLFAKAPWLAVWPLEVRGPLLAFWRTLFAGLFLLPWIRRPTWT